MKKIILSFTICSLIIFSGFLTAQTVQAEAEEQYSITIVPEKYIKVKGDAAKFRAHHWMNDGHSGGIKDFLYEREDDDGTIIRFRGHAIPEENDKGAELEYIKEGFGVMDIHFSSFRKYYDNTGGYYYPFATFPTYDLPEDLKLDIGHFNFAYSPEVGDNFGVTFLYERRTKKGEKSRLTWAEVREGSLRRETTPSYQEIDEVVDIFALQANTTVSGFDLTAEQKYERMDTRAIRYEQWLSSDPNPDRRKKRRQDQNPEATLLTSTFTGNRWFGEDTSFLGMAYRYTNIENSELENILETDEFDNPMNFGFSPKQYVNALADNEVDKHTLTSNYMKELTKHLRVSAKLKGEFMKRDGQSEYPRDSSPAVPDGVIDSLDYSVSKNKAIILGQNFGFHYTGIKKSSIYGDVEIAELKNDFREIQYNIMRDLNWERQTKTKSKKTVYTLGSRVIPSKYFNFTTQYRYKLENNDYDDDVDTAGAINSAFIDSMKIRGNEITSKLTFKPLSWLQTAMRYQFYDRVYETRVQDLDTAEARTRSHTYTYDVFIQALDDLLFNMSYSYQDANTATPAASIMSSAQFPGFNADVQSFLFSSSYTPTDKLSFYGAFTYSFSDNFEDFTSIALPLAVTNSSKSAELGMTWKPMDKNWSVEPHYAYYRYDTSSVSEFGNYNAHVAWLEFNIDW